MNKKVLIWKYKGSKGFIIFFRKTYSEIMDKGSKRQKSHHTIELQFSPFAVF